MILISNLFHNILYNAWEKVKNYVRPLSTLRLLKSRVPELIRYGID